MRPSLFAAPLDLIRTSPSTICILWFGQDVGLLKEIKGPTRDFKRGICRLLIAKEIKFEDSVPVQDVQSALANFPQFEAA